MTKTRQRVIGIALKQAGDVDDIRLQRGKESLAYPLRHLAARLVLRIKLLDGSRRMPDEEVFLGQNVLERFADGLDAGREQTAQRDEHLMRSAVLHHRLGELHRVATDSAVATFCLCTLHVDDDTHQARSLLMCSTSALRSERTRRERAVAIQYRLGA